MYPNYLHVYVNINHFIRSTIFTKTHVELFFFFLSDKCGAQFYFPYIQGEIGKIKDIYIYGTGLTICDTKLGNIHVHLMLQI